MARLARLAVVALSVASAACKPDAAAVARFREYLRIRTEQPSPDYTAAALFLEAQGREIGLEVETIRYAQHKPLVLLTWQGSAPELPSIMLNSHTDVVPAEASFWSHEPFAADLDKSGRIYARGSQDMKCVGMQYLEALRALKAQGFTPLRTIAVTFVPDEEVGGEHGMGAFVESDRFKQLNVGLELDEGWATPEDVFPVFYAERCPWWFVVKASGEPGHGSKLYDGGATENLQAAITRMYAFRKQQYDKVKRGEAALGSVPSLNVVYLRAGVPTVPSAPFADAQFVMNMQPASAEAGFDMRVPPMSAAEMAQLESAMLGYWAPPASNLSVHWVQQSKRLQSDGRPAVTSTDERVNPWWGVFTRSLHAQGLRTQPQIFPAATDASYLRVKGIPSLGFSPMRRTPKLLHEHDEFLSTEAFQEGIAVYTRLVADLASTPDFAAGAQEAPRQQEL